MRVNAIVCAALIAALMPGIARADDPNDPTMRSAAARARDHALIRQLNLAELARTRARDAKLASGWQAWREAHAAGQEASFVPSDQYAARADEHDRAMARYARESADYEHRMAAWRRAVAACRAGDYAACGK